MKKEDNDFAHYGMLSKPNSAISFSNSPWTGSDSNSDNDKLQDRDSVFTNHVFGFIVGEGGDRQDEVGRSLQSTFGVGRLERVCQCGNGRDFEHFAEGHFDLQRIPDERNKPRRQEGVAA